MPRADAGERAQIAVWELAQGKQAAHLGRVTALDERSGAAPKDGDTVWGCGMPCGSVRPAMRRALFNSPPGRNLARTPTPRRSNTI